MAGEFTVASANGVLKPVFGKKLLKVLPQAALLQERYKLSDDVAKVGLDYEVPVMLRAPQGHSFNGSAGGIVTLNGPLAGVYQNAKVPPYEYVLREQVSYGLLDRAKSDGEGAFASAMTVTGTGMTLSGRNVLEIQCLHGQDGIFTMGANVSGQVLTVDDETWSSGMASFLEGAKIDVFQSDKATSRQAGLTISAVNIDNKTLTVTGTATGIVTGDVVYLAGANTAGSFNEMVGLGVQLAEQTATVMNISKTTYSLWRAKVQATVGEFSASALVSAATQIQSRGFVSGTLLAVMSPRAYGVLTSALMVNEIWQGGKITKETGSDKIELKYNGIKIECMAHPFQKDGRCYLLPSDAIRRVGAIDFTFATPGTDAEFLYPVSATNAMELQARANWQIFLEKPSQAALLKGITYSS